MSVSKIQLSHEPAPFEMLPIYQPNDLEFAENKNNNLHNIQTAVKALSQLNHFLQSGRLTKLVLSKFGFHQLNCQTLVAKHLEDLFRYNFPFIMGWGHRDDIGVKQQQLTKLGDAFTETIKNLEVNYNLDPLPTSKSRFVLPRGELTSSYFLQLYPKSFVSDLHALLTTLERTMMFSARVFDVQQALFHTQYFVDLVDGLIHPANFGGIEPFVRDKFENDLDYFVLGYANDLLVNDKRDIMKNAPLNGIYAKKGNCSTRASYADSDPRVDIGEYPINIFEESRRLERKSA